jgi:hypothetical protein
MIGITETDNGTKQRTIQDYEDIRDNLESTIAQEHDIVWQAIKDLAIDLCPKETGALASSIELESEGGSGAIGQNKTTSTVGGDFYSNSIYAGNGSVINPISGKSTAEYALFVHDGHMIGDIMWEGVPFLTEAVAAYEDELEAAVNRALDELGANTQG